MESESQITVSRTSPEDVKVRQVIVKLDGEPFGTLIFGKSKTRAVAPGKHSLHVDNTFNKKSIEFEIAAGEHVKFETINRSGRFTAFLIAIMGAGPMYVSIQRVDA